MPSDPQPGPWRHVGMGLEFAGSVLAMALVGYGVDRWAGTGPWGLIAGVALGAVGGMYLLIKRAWSALK